jgi:tRNA(His) 5'-end guanylyltransferase
MDFKMFDAKMREHEASMDVCVPVDSYMIARLDGHGFSKLTKRLKFEKPFDEKFHAMMLHILCSLMQKSNFHIVYGYTQSDEISLLFSADEQSYSRKTRKLNSLLAGYTSAFATEYLVKEMGITEPVVFDCRVIPLPAPEDVCDYFVWRKEDAERNALNGYCCWMLRLKDHRSARWAASTMDKQSIAWKRKLLRERFEIDFNEVAAWERFGCGMYFTTVKCDGYNPVTGEHVLCERQRLVTTEDIGENDWYRRWLSERFLG